MKAPFVDMHSCTEVSNNADNQTPLQHNYPEHPTQPSDTICSFTFAVAHILQTSAMVIETESKLSKELKQFWDYENLEIKGFPIEENSDTLLNGNIEFTGECYQVSLPGKDYHPIIPDNYALAAKCLS